MATNEPRIQLQWGYNGATPEGVTAAWGVRAVVEDRWVSMGGCRQSNVGPKEEVDAIIKLLNSGVNAEWLARANGLLQDNEIHPARERQVVLYANDVSRLVVVGNTNASHGYLYVSAFFDHDNKTGWLDREHPIA
jgi:hypothetical protein